MNYAWLWKWCINIHQTTWKLYIFIYKISTTVLTLHYLRCIHIYKCIHTYRCREKEVRTADLCILPHAGPGHNCDCECITEDAARFFIFFFCYIKLISLVNDRFLKTKVVGSFFMNAHFSLCSWSKTLTPPSYTHLIALTLWLGHTHTLAMLDWEVGLYIVLPSTEYYQVNADCKRTRWKSP